MAAARTAGATKMAAVRSAAGSINKTGQYLFSVPKELFLRISSVIKEKVDQLVNMFTAQCLGLKPTSIHYFVR